ncbi:hypothetical protein PGT21_029264 [Puccinia graminis f. sp. tritici]|uniref:Uncharacterized protein n=1 Tax=Puccinia graminis f. sp. tritici TaxID=56615 RepID=A0A5B0MM37_PUCGR|nr:hypothetical protein PGT21_029264 [Puccinia graminis f. sp. tritici]
MIFSKRRPYSTRALSQPAGLIRCACAQVPSPVPLSTGAVTCPRFSAAPSFEMSPSASPAGAINLTPSPCRPPAWRKASPFASSRTSHSPLRGRPKQPSSCCPTNPTGPFLATTSRLPRDLTRPTMPAAWRPQAAAIMPQRRAVNAAMDAGRPPSAYPPWRADGPFPGACGMTPCGRPESHVVFMRARGRRARGRRDIAPSALGRIPRAPSRACSNTCPHGDPGLAGCNGAMGGARLATN